jgi:NodT family efflux transporter outer membrane factor (OMF) lipoprotein
MVALVGCKVTLPERAGTALVIPAQWRSNHSSTNEPAGNWWSQFGDQRLELLVHEALGNNPDLRATAIRLEQSQLHSEVAGTRQPTVDVTLNSSKQRNNFIGLPRSITGGGVLVSRFVSHGLSLNTSWEADVWGRLKAGEQKAVADSNAAHADLWAARQSLAAQVVKTWVALTEANEQLSLAQTNIIILDITVNQAELRYDLGVTPALDLRLARTNLASTQAVKEQWQASREQLCRQLETLLGRYPTGFILGSQTLPQLLPDVPAGIPSELLIRRPDIAASSARVMSAQAKIKQAQAELYPKLKLTTSLGTSTEMLKNLLDDNFLVWSFGSEITQPILNGKQLRKNVRLQEALAEELILNHRRIVLNAFGEVEVALVNEAILQSREGHLTEAAGHAGKALDLAEDRYARGLEPFVTVLEAQRHYTEARSQRVSARRFRLENRANLHLALGGDFLKPKPLDWKD